MHSNRMEMKDYEMLGERRVERPDPFYAGIRTLRAGGVDARLREGTQKFAGRVHIL